MLYELMFIAGKDAEVSFFSKVEKTLKDAGAEDIKVDRMGKKTLAYPISRQSEGEYFLLNFKAEGEAIGALREMFMLEKEAVLRYLITKVKIPKKVSKSTKEPFSFVRSTTLGTTEDKKETKKLKAVVTVRTKAREDKKESKRKKTASSKSQKGEKAKGKGTSKKKNN